MTDYLPGYDQYKLASPYDDEDEEWAECEVCGGRFVISDMWHNADGWGDWICSECLAEHEEAGEDREDEDGP